jgi:hypothetical protein
VPGRLPPPPPNTTTRAAHVAWRSRAEVERSAVQRGGGGACLPVPRPAVSCRFPRAHRAMRPSPHHPKRRTPFPPPKSPLFPDPQAPVAAPSHTRTRAPRRLYLFPPLPGTRTLSRRCRWDCSSVGGPCGEEEEEEEEQGAWRRGDCSRDELRRQQLPRARYALVRGFWFTPPAGWGIKVRW